MKMSPQGRAVLTRLEGGRRTQMYKDVAGLATIGVGHLLTRSELTSGKIVITGTPTKWVAGISVESVDRLFSQDLERFEGVVSAALAPIGGFTASQFDALVSFTFNVGTSAFLGSTLLKKVRARLFGEIPAQLERWVYSGGRRIQGLVNRRVFEIRMWRGVYPKLKDL